MGKKIDAAQTVKEFCNAWFALGGAFKGGGIFGQ